MIGNKLLALIRLMYRCEEGGCDTCTEHDGYGCRLPGTCKWNWDYIKDVEELGIEKELITMELNKAIETLDRCIPHPSDNMVDREHLAIAIAWSVIKAELSNKDTKKDEK